MELRPFTHLVSGHSLLLELSEDTVCKPFLFGQEKDFYETMPAAIQQFVVIVMGLQMVKFILYVVYCQSLVIFSLS